MKQFIFGKTCFIALFFIGSILFYSCATDYKRITVYLSETCNAAQQNEAYEVILKRISSIGTIKRKSALTDSHFDISYSFTEDTTISIIPLISQKGEMYITENSDSLGTEQPQIIYLNPNTVEKVVVEKETPYWAPYGIYYLTIEFKKEYHETFARLTKENAEKPLIFGVDDRIIASPVVRDAITNGKVSISGDLEPSELYILKAFIAGGVLPCETHIK